MHMPLHAKGDFINMCVGRIRKRILSCTDIMLTYRADPSGSFASKCNQKKLPNKNAAALYN